jgi:hypothetical protein
MRLKRSVNPEQSYFGSCPFDIFAVKVFLWIAAFWNAICVPTAAFFITTAVGTMCG